MHRLLQTTRRPSTHSSTGAPRSRSVMTMCVNKVEIHHGCSDFDALTLYRQTDYSDKELRMMVNELDRDGWAHSTCTGKKVSAWLRNASDSWKRVFYVGGVILHVQCTCCARGWHAQVAIPRESGHTMDDLEDRVELDKMILCPGEHIASFPEVISYMRTLTHFEGWSQYMRFFHTTGGPVFNGYGSRWLSKKRHAGGFSAMAVVVEEYDPE